MENQNEVVHDHYDTKLCLIVELDLRAHCSLPPNIPKTQNTCNFNPSCTKGGGGRPYLQR